MTANPLQVQLEAAYHLLFTGNKAAASQALSQLHQQAPQHPDVWNGLGLLAEQEGQLEQARQYYLQALALNPEEAEYHNNLALVAEKMGDLETALAAFEQVWRLQADVRSAFNLAQAYRRIGQSLRAQTICQEALWNNPFCLYLHQLLFQLAQSSEIRQDLINWYHQLLRRHPNCAPACYFLACLYDAHGQRTRALNYLKTTLSLQPDWEVAQRQWIVWQSQSDLLTAISSARQFYLQKPDSERLLQYLNLLPPPIFASREEQVRTLAEMERLLDQALECVTKLTNFRLITLPFYLAYQNVDDRCWLEKLGQLYQRVLPIWAEPLPQRKPGRFRIGIVSRFLYRHAVTFCFQGLFQALAQVDELEVFFFPVCKNSPPQDHTSHTLHTLGTWLPLESAQPVLHAAAHIRQVDPDMLIYPEIGMDPFTYMLASSRLARWQVVLAGHPVTSGLSSLDYFVTSAELEIPNCSMHYTEQWVGLPDLIEYHMPVIPPVPTRAELGLPESATLYFCPMTLFKLHPDQDICFANILRGDPNGVLILFQYLQTNYHEVLRQRFQQVMPDVVDRIHFLPFQSFEGFLQYLAHADVALDTFYFGGGNTSFLAFALGIPVVTLPSERLKGRSTLGLYQHMNLSQAVASNPQDYVERALQLGRDSDWRHTFSALIQERKSQIFSQRTWSQAFVAWCLNLLTEDDTA